MFSRSLNVGTTTASSSGIARLCRLARGTPVRDARVLALLLHRDARAAFAARLPAAAVDVPAIAIGAADAVAEQLARGHEDLAQLGVVDRLDAHEWIHARREERLRLPDVPNARDVMLRQKRVADLALRIRAHAAQRFVDVEVVG